MKKNLSLLQEIFGEKPSERRKNMVKTLLEGLVFVAMIVAFYYFMIVLCALVDRCANYYM